MEENQSVNTKACQNQGTKNKCEMEKENELTARQTKPTTSPTHACLPLCVRPCRRPGSCSKNRQKNKSSNGPGLDTHPQQQQSKTNAFRITTNQHFVVSLLVPRGSLHASSLPPLPHFFSSSPPTAPAPTAGLVVVPCFPCFCCCFTTFLAMAINN